MTLKQQQYKKSLIQKIQISKKNVFVDDECRRVFMQSRFNCSSTTQMSIDQLNLLLNFCLRKVSDIPCVEPISTAQIKKIKDLWNIKAKDKHINALNKFILRVSQKVNFSQLTKNEATKVVIALNRMR